ncbi:ATP-dependent nuclease [Sulfitobacter sp. MF3-043]|uniref:ATP-dependent nuclease n=1 Tax=Sulfitobacter sediminivivens TaxID=3252902 RepID=UPI0036D7D5FB
MSKIPALASLKVAGFRGFGEEKKLNFAQPDGSPGSGLTILVGPNNSGKSTVAEAVMAATQRQNKPPTFSEGKRNSVAEGRVKIELTDNEGRARVVETLASGGSESVFSGDSTTPSQSQVFVLPSRRKFEPYFGKSDTERTSYVNNSQNLPNTRAGQTDFSGRIFHINNDPARRTAFEGILGKVLDPLPVWTIDQTDQGNYYLKYSNKDHTHSSDGLGDGILSVFFIVDALYDSESGSTVFIDEPELSLHPQLQAKVLSLLVEFSQDRQIIISTHAPKFIDWNAIVAGAKIARVVNHEGQVGIYELSDDTRTRIKQLLADMNNPHVLGLDANEVFFLSDGVLLVEGQEDVMYFPKVLNDLGLEIDAEFYGWGVGGATKMGTIAAILNDLGFSKVAGILDGNLSDHIPSLQEQFREYHFVSHPADDVRYKKDRPELTSLLDEKNKSVREEFRQETTTAITAVRQYFKK